MKRYSRVAWVLGSALLIPALVLAEEAKRKGPGQGDQAQHHDRQGGPEAMHRGPMGGPMMERLKLTDEQKKKIANLRKKHEEEFLSILTSEQKKTFEEWKKESPFGGPGGPPVGGFAGRFGPPPGGPGGFGPPPGSPGGPPQGGPGGFGRGPGGPPPGRPEAENRSDSSHGDVEKKLDRLAKELEELRRELRR